MLAKNETCSELELEDSFVFERVNVSLEKIFFRYFILNSPCLKNGNRCVYRCTRSENL